MKRNRNTEQFGVGLDHLPANKYEGIDMAPVLDFVQRYLHIEAYTPNIVESVFRLWIQNNGFLDRLFSFSRMRVWDDNARPQVKNYLAAQFIRQFRDDVLPDFYPGNKTNSVFKSASRMCNALILFSKSKKGKDIIFGS